MRLLLVRHGESICGFNGIVGGTKGCTGLTERGFAQARLVRDRLQREVSAPDVIVASTLPRAIQTGEVIAEPFGLGVIQDDELCELVPGEADGLLWSEWQERYGFDPSEERDRPISPGGESVNSFHARVRAVLRRFAKHYAGQTVIAACHGGIVFNSVYAVLDAERRDVWLRADNTSITEWTYTDDRWTLHRFNDVAHLVGTDLLVDQGAP